MKFRTRTSALAVLFVVGLLASGLAAGQGGEPNRERSGQDVAELASAKEASAKEASAKEASAEEASAEEASAKEASAIERGYRFLTEKPYLPPDFDQQTFDDVWRSWPEPLRQKAEDASRDERRRMAFERYGLTPRPGDESGKPLQYVVDEKGNWTMNCFACHSGEVAGKVIPGLPNTRYRLQTLTEETRLAKLRLGKPLSRMDIGAIFMPLGTNVGTTNAVMFGVALMASRDAELNVLSGTGMPAMVHHDMDAPPWWHFRKRPRIYIDGFAEKGHRALMQFMLVKENGPEKFREWEPDFRDVYAYMQSLEAPRYPFAIDEALAARGEKLFLRSCAECHGTYGEQESYPGLLVPIDEVGTDRVRLDALTAEHRENYGRSWFAYAGSQETLSDPGGYVAPPLDGVWASAPYLHNGSVPTLWHVLHTEERPAVWRRVPWSDDEAASDYDRERMGLAVETFDAVPPGLSAAARREYFDTSGFGKSAAGHLFPEQLTEAEKRAVLEYLKTL